jgi:hypothetical protein
MTPVIGGGNTISVLVSFEQAAVHKEVNRININTRCFKINGIHLPLLNSNSLNQQEFIF